MTSSSTYGMTYVKPGSSIPDNAPKRSLTPTEFVGIERKPNRSEKRVSAIPTQAIIPSTNRTGLMPKLGEAGPEERITINAGYRQFGHHPRRASVARPCQD